MSRPKPRTMSGSTWESLAASTRKLTSALPIYDGETMYSVLVIVVGKYMDKCALSTRKLTSARRIYDGETMYSVLVIVVGKYMEKFGTVYKKTDIGSRDI